MRRVLLLAMLGVLSFGVAAATMTFDEAVSLFQNGQIMIEYSDAGKAELEEIIDALKTGLGVPASLNEDDEAAVGAHPVPMEMKEVVNYLSQAYYTLANVFMIEPEAYKTYRFGKHWGFKSLRMNPEFDDTRGGRFDASVARETDIAALYWTNANWLRASKENKMAAVFAGVPAKTEMLTNRVLELAPDYLIGGAYRSFGGYYEQLPSLFGRDINKALFYLCHVVDEPLFCATCEAGDVVDGADEYFENRTFFAEFYLIPQKRWTDAARVLQSVLDEPIGDLYPLMNAYAQAHARTLMEEVQKNL